MISSGTRDSIVGRLGCASNVLFFALYVILRLPVCQAFEEQSTNNNNNNKTNRDGANTSNNNKNEECGLYLAASTIPGAGLGIFAGRDFDKGQVIAPGDVVVPTVDLDRHNKAAKKINDADKSRNKQVEDHNLPWLWDEYSWYAFVAEGMEQEGAVVDAHSPGFGAAVNSLPALININHMGAEVTLADSAGLHRGRDPGAGAFTPFYNRQFHATRDIAAGDEMFADYGTDYFETRTAKYGPIPLTEGDWGRADWFLHRFAGLAKNHLRPSIAKDLWESVVSTVPWQSRTTTALPANFSDIPRMLQRGTRWKDEPRSKRALTDLEFNGKCMDNIRPGRSTIPQAGRGAFASRYIPAGAVVSPSPLIHAPYKSRLDMYELDDQHEPTYFQIYSEENKNKNDDPVRHRQLLLNYCFGHAESSILLCPYGLLTLLINHSREKFNTKIVWSDNAQHPEWMDMPVEAFGEIMSAGLSLDYVAVRDIQPGEEILIDYGEEWEEAWQRHLREWKPPIHNDNDSRHLLYESALELNQKFGVLRTVREGGYNTNQVRLLCRDYYLYNHPTVPPRERRAMKERADKRDEDDDDNNPGLPCQILERYRVGSSGETLYTAQVVRHVNHDLVRATVVHKERLFWDLPRDAFVFRDVPYTRDHSMAWSFRHEMMIPDEIFPNVWKNRK